jgi:hypothetical protein
LDDFFFPLSIRRRPERLLGEQAEWAARKQLGRTVMNRFAAKPERSGRQEIDRVIEPLASYICATERPGAALRSVVSALLRSVEETNRTARRHFRAVVNGGAT